MSKCHILLNGIFFEKTDLEITKKYTYERKY